jgi:hypothetical protein
MDFDVFSSPVTLNQEGNLAICYPKTQLVYPIFSEDSKTASSLLPLIRTPEDGDKDELTKDELLDGPIKKALQEWKFDIRQNPLYYPGVYMARKHTDHFLRNDCPNQLISQERKPAFDQKLKEMFATHATLVFPGIKIPLVNQIATDVTNAIWDVFKLSKLVRNGLTYVYFDAKPVAMVQALAVEGFKDKGITIPAEDSQPKIAATPITNPEAKILETPLKEPETKVTIFPPEEGKVKVQITYPGEDTAMRVLTFKISKEAIEKANSAGLGEPKSVSKGKGLRWQIGEKGDNVIRLMPGDLASQWDSQKENYVHIRRKGKVIGSDQQEVKPTRDFPDPKRNPISHINENEWLKWKTPLGEDK